MTKKHQIRLYFVLVTLVLFAFSLSGCDKKVSQQHRGSQNRQSRNESQTSQPLRSDRTRSDVSGQDASDTTRLILYFSDAQAEKLVREIRKVPKTQAVAQAAVEELIKGPAQGDGATIPKDTRLLSIKVQDGVAEVNLSREFIDNHAGGSAGERLTVYSIVNTLTEFGTIGKVRFLVEGSAIDTIAGHMDTSEPIKRNDSLF